jgi:hypothetical protein
MFIFPSLLTQDCDNCIVLIIDLASTFRFDRSTTPKLPIQYTVTISLLAQVLRNQRPNR